MMVFISDDAPKGNYAKLQKTGAMSKVSATTSFKYAARNWNTWILFVQVRHRKAVTPYEAQ